LVAITGGKSAERLPLFADDQVEREEFDLAVDANGQLLLAYVPKGKQEGELANRVCIRTLTGKQWSKPLLIVNGEEVRGGLKAVSTPTGRVFITWIHRVEMRNGQSVLWGPVRFFIVSTPTGWTAPQPAASYSGPGPILRGPYMGGFFPCLFLDREGFVRMAWGDGPRFYHAIVTRLVPAASQPAQ
jgi:hypothetical protein